MSASGEFIDLANQALGEIFDSLPFYEQDLMMQPTYHAQESPTSYDLKATATPDGHLLLGEYFWQPEPKVIIFEDSIRKGMAKFGSLYSAIREVLRHEIMEHHFGYDHTRESIEAGLVPAYMIDAHGMEYNPVVHGMLR